MNTEKQKGEPMKINYTKPGDARKPRQLFMLINEFSFDAFPVRPRHMAPSRGPARAGRNRAIRMARKGGRAC
jgi:hypothetical protein